jgi:uncharacterized OsmC-like protein
MSNPSASSPVPGTLTEHRALAKGRDGLAVEVDVGDSVVRVDLPVARGGSGSAPAPGPLMRASVAACLLMDYKIFAADLGVPIDGIEVELSTQIDMSGQAGAPGVPPGWQSIRWHVRVTSDASAADIERVLAQAERLSPMLDNLHPRCERKRTYEVRRTTP